MRHKTPLKAIIIIVFRLLWVNTRFFRQNITIKGKMVPVAPKSVEFRIREGSGRGGRSKISRDINFDWMAVQKFFRLRLFFDFLRVTSGGEKSVAFTPKWFIFNARLEFHPKRAKSKPFVQSATLSKANLQKRDFKWKAFYSIKLTELSKTVFKEISFHPLSYSSKLSHAWAFVSFRMKASLTPWSYVNFDWIKKNGRAVRENSFERRYFLFEKSSRGVMAGRLCLMLQ